MLSCFVKALLAFERFRKNQIAAFRAVLLASPSPVFSAASTLPKSIRPEPSHSKSFAHSCENTGGIPPKSEIPAKLTGSLSAQHRARGHLFTKPSPAPRHHN